ncbi:sodium-coupled monocarboxylate transporter 1-like isoform X1 [Varroa jacobsoni]|uniref:sodium-coupled monocarboxylate transporter 1-like isoform X1 n=1 Tax=Varroa jacobsoni TaxID=62625 RepID=UPI000BF5D385|nr:sodium-coupled monocarboxylate transporter 1-like isoform X1 [Varroa jacobsoni]
MSASFHILDYAVLVGSFVLPSLIGLFFTYKDRHQQNKTEHFLGSRQLGVIPVCLSLMASFLSAITVLGYPAEVYMRGASISISYLERRFHTPILRRAISGATALSCIIYLGVQLYAPSIAIEATTGISVPVSMVSVGLICTFYTTIGGMKAVVWSDVFQMSLMFFALAMVLVKAVYDVGGIDEVYRKTNEAGRLNLSNFRVDPYAADSFWNCFLGMGVLWFSANGMSQQQVQRYCSLPTMKKARLALYLNMIGVALTLSKAFVCGLAIYAFYHGCDPLKLGLIRMADQIMPYFVLDRFHIPGVRGLFVAAVFAGSLSTLSSGLNSMSACLWEDFFAPLLSPDIGPKRAVLFTKCIALGLGVLAIGFGFISAYIGNILQASLGMAAAITGPACAVYLAGVTLPFVNTVGVSIGFAVSLAVCIWSVVGKLLNPLKYPVLLVSAEFCNWTTGDSAVSTVDQNTTVFYSRPLLDTIHPKGLQHLYYIHPYVMPAFGLVLTIAIAIIVSIFTGGNSQKKIDSGLFNRTCYRTITWTPPICLNIFCYLGSVFQSSDSKPTKDLQAIHEDISLETQNSQNSCVMN